MLFTLSRTDIKPTMAVSDVLSQIRTLCDMLFNRRTYRVTRDAVQNVFSVLKEYIYDDAAYKLASSICTSVMNQTVIKVKVR